MKGDKLLGFYKLPLSEIVQDDAKYAVAFKKVKINITYDVVFYNSLIFCC